MKIERKEGKNEKENMHEVKTQRKDDTLAFIQRFKEEALIPMKEDIADWISLLLAPQKTSPEELLSALCTGVLACQIARKLSSQVNLDFAAPKVNEKAKVGTFFARDNAANFLTWCRKLGVSESLLFESDGMCSNEVSQQTPRQVLLCFLDVARIFGRRADYKGALPDLVKFEQEIDNASVSSSDTVTSCGRASAPPVIRTPTTTPSRPGSSKTTPSSVTPRRNSKATTGISGPSPRTSKTARPKTATPKSALKTKLDTSIDEVVQSEPFYGGPEIQRVSEGKYRIDGKLVFIRMLKDKHVMVRVGGGWDTLANYLLKHDCQNMIRLPTPTRLSKQITPVRLEQKDGGYLFPISPRYKSGSPSPLKPRKQSVSNKTTPKSKEKV
ncbi:Oidioi.mRNA.OKI2018_I69.PAR.g8943.t1.cds [Oikopleura dioica]|uniref:Oidioi.mRNA.OKI2018_I69.PAR.g8943.t1.cds n=1 Tax=Oikopleura dioica TaxID=34765 RepID=A0ABN7RIA6_OIKDI|nr:Oidioi.mRNA.OKI2018_I69.PAR.g8943.t1.cds [Oikopleura dioica]